MMLVERWFERLLNRLEWEPSTLGLIYYLILLIVASGFGFLWIAAEYQKHGPW